MKSLVPGLVAGVGSNSRLHALCVNLVLQIKIPVLFLCVRSMADEDVKHGGRHTLVSVIMWHYRRQGRNFPLMKRQTGYNLCQTERQEEQQDLFYKTQICCSFAKKDWSMTAVPLLVKAPRYPIYFPSIILWSQWKHGIIFEGGMEKTTADCGQHSFPLTTLGCVWVAAALLNPVWNFWLQRQHMYVFFSCFLCIQCKETCGCQFPGKSIQLPLT